MSKYTLNQFEADLHVMTGQNGCLHCCEDLHPPRYTKHLLDMVEIAGWQSRAHKLAEKVALLGIPPNELANLVRNLEYDEYVGLIDRNCVQVTDIMSAIRKLLAD